MPIISDAYRFIAPILLLCLFCAFFDWRWAALALLAISAFVCYFFRNPPRTVPDGRNLVVSPADGKVVKVDGGDSESTQISIFLSVFDVHVNRSPIGGRLHSLEYKRGRFRAAFDDEASRTNEQNVITIMGEDILVVVRQIAGLIARRVVCWKKPGDPVQRGELFGLIRFGSRVDVILPKEVRILVKVGQRVKGGISILGEYP